MTIMTEVNIVTVVTVLKVVIVGILLTIVSNNSSNICNRSDSSTNISEGKYQNCHIVLLVLFSSLFGSLVLFQLLY